MNYFLRNSYIPIRLNPIPFYYLNVQLTEITDT
ncbi:hypothetical protein HDF26_000766 [Pedobacter cryoconitis]|nr:hypothetical protein [Pedobacter cryoconitis]